MLQVAHAGNWDFRETFYTFCMQVNIRSDPKSLIEAYKLHKQSHDETAISYLMSMEHKSGPIIDTLGGEKAALEIAIDGLSSRQLQLHLIKLLKAGTVTTFPECHAVAKDIMEEMGWAENTVNTNIPYARQRARSQSSEKRTYQKRGGEQKLGGWRGRRSREQSGDTANSDATTDTHALKEAPPKKERAKTKPGEKKGIEAFREMMDKINYAIKSSSPEAAQLVENFIISVAKLKTNPKVNLTKLWSDTYDGFIASATKQLAEKQKGSSEAKPAQQKGHTKQKGKPNSSKPQADKKESEDTA